MGETATNVAAATAGGSEWDVGDVGDVGATSGGAGDGPSLAIKRRAPIACRRLVYDGVACRLPDLIADKWVWLFRCRRMRSKCVHDKAQPPCKACEEAGLGAEDW